ncbi:MAG: hypothetical protein BWK79_20250 [Beggiatoa sp. IS2]|nr:MAG: hypothetical protein BWK79_20250 [Beggiatoa sp. IS2]
MSKKSVVQFTLDDGSQMYVETTEDSASSQRVSKSREGIEEAEKSFSQAIAHLKPAAEKVLQAFKEMNSPDEVRLEFGLRLSGKVGAIFVSADSEATFKISLLWKKQDESV